MWCDGCKQNIAADLHGFRSISRSSVDRCSSYSTVLKYSSVLSKRRVWAESVHWWRRYTSFCDFALWTYTVGNCQYNGWRSANIIAKIVFVIYLRHQWSDSVHILRFDSTDEYFKTVEYEEQRPTELRDIERKPCGSAEIFRPQPSPQTLFFQILSFVWAEITFI